MKPFAYQRAQDVQSAIQAVSGAHAAKFLGGGTNLVDLMKDDVEKPSRLIDIQRLDLANIEEQPNGGIRIGATVRNSDMANHPLVKSRYPLITQATLSGASQQLRNLATTGGNLMQRTRCYYFMDTTFPACNKRNPGSGCAAIDGWNRLHAIFGTSNECIATHPSDFCVALAAYDATVNVRGPKGARAIAMADFHRLPGDTPQLDTNLAPDELILSVDLPATKFGSHTHYLKVRDRNSYAFALVSVAAALELDGQTIRSVRIALGGVAPKPWRATAAEKLLTGATFSDAVLRKAGEAATEGAKTYRYNAFKVDLLQRAVPQALRSARGAA